MQPYPRPFGCRPFLAIACPIENIITSSKFFQSKLVMENWLGDLNQLQPEKYFE